MNSKVTNSTPDQGGGRHGSGLYPSLDPYYSNQEGEREGEKEKKGALPKL